MTASVGFLEILVGVALVVCTLSPIILLALFARDARGGRLW